MDFINELTSASLNEPRNEVSVGIFDELFDEFAIELFIENDDSFAKRLVEFGVGGPG